MLCDVQSMLMEPKATTKQSRWIPAFAGMTQWQRRSSCERAIASLSAFHVADHPPLLRHLPLGQHVLLPFVRIRAFLEYETHRGSHELEALAEEILQVALVAFAQRTQARAVNNESRRIRTTGMREAH